jgi:hypothetical protein
MKVILLITKKEKKEKKFNLLYIMKHLNELRMQKEH